MIFAPASQAAQRLHTCFGPDYQNQPVLIQQIGTTCANAIGVVQWLRFHITELRYDVEVNIQHPQTQLHFMEIQLKGKWQYCEQIIATNGTFDNRGRLHASVAIVITWHDR